MKLFIIRALTAITLLQLTGSCVYKEIPDSLHCTDSDLAITLVSKIDASNCKAIDGQIEVTGTDGAGPYDYKIGDGIYQTNPVFTDLGPGTYSITVKDTKSCTNVLSVTLLAANSTLAATFSSSPDNQCLAPHNGSIVVSPAGGTAPYLIKLGDGAFGSATGFSALKSGIYTIAVRDSDDCEIVLQVLVARGDTGVSYSNQIAPVFAAACNFSGCHGPGTGGRDWTVFSNVQTSAAQIMSRTGNRSMPIGTGPTLTDNQIALIACWVTDGAKNN